MPSFLSINTPPEGGLDSLGLAHLSAGFEAGKTPKCGCVMPLLMISRHRETWRDWLLPQAPGFSRGVMTHASIRYRQLLVDRKNKALTPKGENSCSIPFLFLTIPETIPFWDMHPLEQRKNTASFRHSTIKTMLCYW